MDDMSKEVLARIDALAAKLGTTAEHLWASLVEDIQRRGFGMAIVLGVCSLLFAAVAWRMRRADDEDEYAILVSSTALFLLFIFWALTNLHTALAPNVEAWKILTGGG